MKRRMRKPNPTEILITVIFFAGGMFGCILARKEESSTISQIVDEYLSGFLGGHSPLSMFFSNLLVYIKYPLFLFVFSFTIFGIIAIPCVVFIKGYALSYAFAALIRVIGIRSYWTIPMLFVIQGICFLPFYLFASALGLRSSWQLMQQNLMHSKTMRTPKGKPDFHALFTCFAIIFLMSCICAAFDTYVAPKLLEILNLI